MINHVSDFHEQPSVHVKCEVSSALVSVDLFYCNSLNASGSFSSLPPEVHVSTLNTQHSDVRLCTGFSGAGQVFCVKGDVSFTFQLIFSSIYEIRDGLFFQGVSDRLTTTLSCFSSSVFIQVSLLMDPNINLSGLLLPHWIVSPWIMALLCFSVSLYLYFCQI